MFSNNLISVIVNGSEHTYNFSLADVLFLRNYSRRCGYEFSSMIGGCESIRDIQQAKNLQADFIECTYVESLFAYTKLHRGITSLFNNEPHASNYPIVFHIINTIRSAEAVPDVLEYAKTQSTPINVVPVYDRRALIKSIHSLNDNDFDVSEAEYRINSYIVDITKQIGLSPFGIAGGITGESIRELMKKGVYPSFIRLGLFTIHALQKSIIDSKTIMTYQHKEALLLESIRATLSDKYNYVTARQHHIMNYLLEASIND